MSISKPSKLPRVIPLMTEEEERTCQEDFLLLRSNFAAWCAKHQYYNTLGLLSACELQMDDKCPSIAAVTNVERLTVYFHPYITKLWRKDPHASFVVIVHELRHLIQLEDFRAVTDLVDLTPIIDVLVSYRDKATDPAAIKVWQGAIERYNDPKNRKTMQLRQQASNLTMDIALHEDVLVLLPKEKEVNDFLRNDFIPYFSGQPVAEEDKAKISLQTVATLSSLIEKDLPRGKEWLYYCQEYINWMAKQFEDQDIDPNNPPSGGGGDCDGDGLDDALAELGSALDTMDEHEFGQTQGKDAQDRIDKARERVQAALRKAREEARFIEHINGTNAADTPMFGNPAAELNAKIRKLVNKIQIKFARIWSPSNFREYSFSRIHKLFPDESFPGHIRPPNRKKSVIMVIDTSGSMYSQVWLDQMCAAARELHKQGKLTALWCCDTELHKMEFEGKSQYKMIGGGGTVLGSKQVDTMLADIKATKGVDIVYLTDMQLDLDEISKDKRINFHTIDVPKAMGHKD